MSGSSGNKRQRVEEEVDVKLSAELRELMGGRKYIKEEELTRAVLLEWAKRQGAVKEVKLISITVQSMGGTETEVTLEDSDTSVRSLKLAIQDSQGVASFTQQRRVLYHLHSSCSLFRRRAAIKLKPVLK
jgi:hypothetical protein